MRINLGVSLTTIVCAHALLSPSRSLQFLATRASPLLLSSPLQEKNLTSSSTVQRSVHGYTELHESGDAQTRVDNYKSLVNAYYDLATVFYEWGWGSSFHFAARHVAGYARESFDEAIRRHEYQLASFLQLVPSRPLHILDVGCGIGGPMRNIARFFNKQVNITGITLNEYQVQRGNELSQLHNVGNVCKSVQGDFMHLPFESGALDGAYAIEATCHAPDRVKCYGEIARVLKPGAIFACYEWCMTDTYDANNPEHQRLKKDIELGNGLPDIIGTSDCLEAMRQAGFEVLHEHDAAELAKAEGAKLMDPWETPLLPSWNPLSQRFQFNAVGGPITNVAIYLLELLRIAPAGTVKTQKVLQAGGFALRDAGQEGIFTTMYLMVGRKPHASTSQ
jgi:sterol 24-C-methyltransferase